MSNSKSVNVERVSFRNPDMAWDIAALILIKRGLEGGLW